MTKKIKLEQVNSENKVNRADKSEEHKEKEYCLPKDLLSLVNLVSLKKSLKIDSYPLFPFKKDIVYTIKLLSKISEPFETINGLAQSIIIEVQNHGKRHMICNNSFIFSLARVCAKYKIENYINLECKLQKTDMKDKNGQKFVGFNLYKD